MRVKTFPFGKHADAPEVGATDYGQGQHCGRRISPVRLVVTIVHVKLNECGAEVASAAAVGPGRRHAMYLIAPTPNAASCERRGASGRHTFL